MDNKSKLKTELKTKLKQEMSVTGTGASVTPGVGMGVATKYAFKKKVKEDAPQLAGGKVKDVYAVSHFGFKEAPKIPNRPSKAIDYKELWEGLEVDDRVKVVYGNEFFGETGTVVDIVKGFAVIEMDRDGKEYSMHVSDVEKIDDEEDDMLDEAGTDEVVATLNNPNLDPDVKKTLMSAYRQGHITADGVLAIVNLVLKKGSINEGYAQFRNETKMRSKPDQFHQAVKQIKKKMNEINRIFEYVDRLKTELSEGEDLKYKKYTENAFTQIKESAKQLFLKSTKLK